MYEVIGILIKIMIVLGINLTVVAYLILVERKIAAFAQDRVGPNRAGLDLLAKFPILKPIEFLLRPLFRLGFLHPLVDGAKMLLKEDVVPGYVNKPLYILAPCIAIVAAVIAFAVIPFGPVGVGTPNGPMGNIQFQIAPGLDVGIVYVFAVGSLAVYAVLLAGWSSNNKYSFLGGVRSSAQIISYEIPLGMSILGMVLLARSLDLNTIVNWQEGRYLFGVVPAWGIFVQPLGFLLFLVSSFAETNRLPFDLPESEQELVGGFHTEYSAMKFGMFFLGEYLHVITVSFLVAVLFLGGWDFPFLNQLQTGWLSALAKAAVLTGKVAVMIVFIMWIRWTLPRFRYDQLMDLAWKTMIPLALVNLVATAAILQFWRG